MSKKNSKRTKPRTAEDDALNACPRCGLTSSTSADGLNSLLLSHAELRRALRLAGRWMVQVACPDGQMLDRMRQTLKEAEEMAFLHNLPSVEPSKPRSKVTRLRNTSRGQGIRLITPRSAAGSSTGRNLALSSREDIF